MKTKQGFAIHCHHDTLVEYCYDYQERVDYIKSYKLKQEQKLRLKLFKMLPKKALLEIPLEYQEAYQKWEEACQKWQEADQKRQEADQKWEEACQKWQEACQKRQEACQKWEEACQKWQEADQKWEEADQKRQEADQKWEEADQKWPQSSKDEFHKKWCGCKEWNGKEIVFK